jgi:outer membrane protein assembly factor BamB/tRNA A-37 threonylcarbamoyl transferase component Bud32
MAIASEPQIVEFGLRNKIDGQFKVVEKHRGGMSILYVVVDDFSQKRFAVKTLKEEGLEDRAMVNRFAAEARTWMNIPYHEHIVQAIIYRQLDGQPFLFLEYVEGTDLQALLDVECPLALPQILAYGIQSCRGMAHVHSSAAPGSSHGIVHRDIKPGNLMITREGKVKITDFGLAKAYGTSTRLTPSATGMGTYAYMPPEQFVDAGSADRTSDIYSFGVVLYQALTGMLPFSGQNLAALMNAILNKRPMPPRDRNAEIPERLDAAILKCMAKRRDDRYQRFDEVGDELAVVLGELPAGLVRFVCGKCGFLTQRKYPACHVCSGTMQPLNGTQPAEHDAELFASVAVDPNGAVIERQHGAAEATPAAAVEGSSAEEQYEEGVRLRKAGRLREALAKLRAAHEADPDASSIRAALDEVALAYAHSKRKRSAEVQSYNWPMSRCSVVRTGYTPEHVLPPLGQRWQYRVGKWVFATPAVSNAMVYVGGREEQMGKYGRLCAIDKRGGLIWDIHAGYEINSSPAIMEGSRLFVGMERRLYCLDAHTGRALWEFATQDIVQSSPAAWRGAVFVGSQDGNVYAVNAETGSVIWAFPTELGILSSPTVWKDAVFIGSRDHRVYALDATDGSRCWDFMTGDEVVATPAYASGNLVVGSLDHRVYCLDASTGGKRWEFRTAGPVDSSPAIAANVVYVGSRDRRIYALDLVSGQTRWTFETGDWVQSSPAVSGGVVYCGSHDGMLYALEAETGARIWQWELGAEVRSSPAVSSGTVIVGCNDGRVYCFSER